MPNCSASKGAITPLKEIVKFSKKHLCNGSFRLNDEEISNFNPDVDIQYISTGSLYGETTIYGKIIRIGGEDPKIHFRINDIDKIIFDVNEELAKKLSPRLYEFIGLIGKAEWNAEKFNIEKFEITNIVDIEDKSIFETFEDIRGLIGKYWDEIEDVETYIN